MSWLFLAGTSFLYPLNVHSMPKNIKGQISVGQKIISILVSVGTAVLHAFLAKKGIHVPMDDLINPVSTGGSAGAITALLFKASGNKETTIHHYGSTK